MESSLLTSPRVWYENFRKLATMFFERKTVGRFWEILLKIILATEVSTTRILYRDFSIHVQANIRSCFTAETQLWDNQYVTNRAGRRRRFSSGINYSIFLQPLPNLCEAFSVTGVDHVAVIWVCLLMLFALGSPSRSSWLHRRQSIRSNNTALTPYAHTIIYHATITWWLFLYGYQLRV